MLSTNLKSFITLRRVMGVLLLCCAQHIAHASEATPTLTAAELSEEQWFAYVMDMTLDEVIVKEKMAVKNEEFRKNVNQHNRF